LIELEQEARQREQDLQQRLGMEILDYQHTNARLEEELSVAQEMRDVAEQQQQQEEWLQKLRRSQISLKMVEFDKPQLLVAVGKVASCL
jgi:hypothetical protein